MKVKEGDLLLLATDGVFDNLFESEILSVIKTFSNHSKTKQTAYLIAKRISELALQKSKEEFIKTPFQIKKAEFIKQN